MAGVAGVAGVAVASDLVGSKLDPSLLLRFRPVLGSNLKVFCCTKSAFDCGIYIDLIVKVLTER